MKDEKDREADTRETSGIIPPEFFAQIGHGEYGEHRKRDDFLDCFELSRAEFERADAIGWDLKAVFEKGDAPTGQNNFPESLAAVLKMAVPSEGHEDVGDSKKEDGSHEEFGSSQERVLVAALF
jgi:hypothetical protein